MVLNALVGSGFHLEALQRVLCLGNNDIALRHGISPFQITGSTAADSGDLLPYPLPRYRVRRNCQTTLQPFVGAIPALPICHRRITPQYYCCPQARKYHK